MLQYQDLTKHFGLSLFDENVQTFLSGKFSDLTEYNILESDYITSVNAGIDLGFINKEAVYDDDDHVIYKKGNPLFSHFILYPKSCTCIDRLPFDIDFNDDRTEVIKKAGIPTMTKEGYADFLNTSFLVENYKVDEIVITFDYNTENQKLNFIQIRDNNLVEHLKM